MRDHLWSICPSTRGTRQAVARSSGAVRAAAPCQRTAPPRCVAAHLHLAQGLKACKLAAQTSDCALSLRCPGAEMAAAPWMLRRQLRLAHRHCLMRMWQCLCIARQCVQSACKRMPVLSNPEATWGQQPHLPHPRAAATATGVGHAAAGTLHAGLAPAASSPARAQHQKDSNGLLAAGLAVCTALQGVAAALLHTLTGCAVWWLGRSHLLRCQHDPLAAALSA